MDDIYKKTWPEDIYLVTNDPELDRCCGQLEATKDGADVEWVRYSHSDNNVRYIRMDVAKEREKLLLQAAFWEGQVYGEDADWPHVESLPLDENSYEEFCAMANLEKLK